MASYNSRIPGSSSTQSRVGRFIGEGLPFQISSQNPNEEIMNVLAREIPKAKQLCSFRVPHLGIHRRARLAFIPGKNCAFPENDQLTGTHADTDPLHPARNYLSRPN